MPNTRQSIILPEPSIQGMSWVNTKLRKVDYHIDWKTFKMTGTSFMFNYANEDVLSILGLELCRWRYLLALYGWRCRLKQIQKSKKLPRDAKPATKTQIHWILTSDIKLKPLFRFIVGFDILMIQTRHVRILFCRLKRL